MKLAIAQLKINEHLSCHYCRYKCYWSCVIKVSLGIRFYNTQWNYEIKHAVISSVNICLHIDIIEVQLFGDTNHLA